MAVNNAVNLVPTISGTANQITVTPAGPTAVPTIGTASTQLSTTQPMFSAHVSATVSNVTGDGTIYPVVFDVADINQGSNYNASNGQFTAPVTGNYLFIASVVVTTTNVFTAVQTLLQLTGSASINYIFDFSQIAATITNATSGGSVIVPMVAADVAAFTVNASGGTKTTSVIFGSSSQRDTYFCGYLLH